jgi:hypothetical protein
MSSLLGLDNRLIQVLPPKARLLCARLIAVARDCEDAFLSLLQRRETLIEEIAGVRAERDQAVRRAQNFGQDVEAAARDYTTVISDLEGEVSALDAQRDRRELRRNDSARLIGALRAFLETQASRHVVLANAVHSAPLCDDESLVAAIGRIRAEIAAVKTELHVLAAAPLTKDELREKARAWVVEMAKAGMPQLYVERGNFEVRFQPGALANGPLGPAAAALVAVTNPEGLTAVLEHAIDHLPAGTGISEADRPEKERALNIKLDQLERDEEVLISRANEDGADVLRRPEASCWAVLGVALGKVQAKAS